MFKSKQLVLTAVGMPILLSLFACSDSNTNSSANSSSTSFSSADSNATVEEALLELPNSLLPRFAINNSEVTADEVFRSIDFSSNPNGVRFWGVEGASPDETFELEVLYADDGSVVENVRNDILDSLPANIESALLAQYPDASINEIERATSESGIAFAILFDTMGEELEGNFDDAGNFLHIEDIQQRDEFPAEILAIIDSLNVDMPFAEYEQSTFADGSIGYAVEFENDNGQSITINMDSIGVIQTIEHEDALENLSSSDTVETALANFPAGIQPDFAANFPEVTAAEIFRQQLFNANGSEFLFGIEGLTENEEIEIEAIYNSEITLLEQVRGEIIESLPTEVENGFTSRFPNVEIDEIAEIVTADGTSYSIVFLQNDEELEANYSAAGDFLNLENVLEESEIPLQILDAIGAQRVLLPIVEFEEVTQADGTITYTVEYENDEGESISYGLDAAGTILQIDHEAGL